MDIIPALAEAFGNMFHPLSLLAVFIATIVSIIVGVLPAVTGSLMIIIILPFLFGADPVIALPALCALLVASGLGGSITSVLAGIPGDNPNAPAVLDGFPMTRKGQAGRGLGLAIGTGIGSAVVGVLISIGIIPLMAPILMAFKTVEMFLIVLLSLLFLSVLTKGSQIKGLVSAGIGLTISCIGFQVSTGQPRLNFGSLYLYDGLEASTVLLGMLAVPILVELIAEGLPISKDDGESTGGVGEVLRGMIEVYTKHFWTWLRAIVIGYVIGIAPALGSGSAVWIAYGQAKNASKHPEEFGNGAPEGIIAPEAARAVCNPGDLLTTLVFGIPGSSIMVVFLAAFLMMGITPGPALVVQHTALAFQMIMTMGLSVIIAGIILIGMSPLLVKVTRLSPHIMFVVLIPLIILGAYVSRGYAIDIIVIGVTSLIGLCVKRFGFSAPAIILGYVMGDLFERYFIRSLDIHGAGLFWSSPLSIVITLGILITVFFEPVKSLLGKLRNKKVASMGETL
jgi:TctA family transporter